MEQVKISKRKTKKAFSEKQNPDPVEGSKAVIFDREFGVKLTLDNSLKRFAKDPFIIEQTKIANRKFAKGKT